MSPLHWPVEAWLAAGVCVTVLTIALKEDRREQRERRELRDEWASFEMAGAEIIPLAVRRRYREIREPYDQLRPVAFGHPRQARTAAPGTKTRPRWCHSRALDPEPQEVPMAALDSTRGLRVSLPAPAEHEVDAVERVLADAHSQPCDHYWRSIAAECLEAAKQAQLQSVLASIDAEVATRVPASLMIDVLDRRQSASAATAGSAHPRPPR